MVGAPPLPSRGVADEQGRLTQDEAAAVFRRAAELEAEADPTGATAGGLDRTAVEVAAVEAGLSPAAVRRAMSELEAGRLSVERGRRFSWKASTATVERALPMPAGTAVATIEAFLRRQTFRTVRRRGDVSVWEPASGLSAQVVRGTDLSGRLRLKKVNLVTVCVTPDLTGLSCTVRIDLDFTAERRKQRGGAITGVVVGTTVVAGAATAAVIGPELALLAVPGGAGIGVGGWFGARSSYSSAVDKAVSAIELVLDELEAGASAGRY